MAALLEPTFFFPAQQARKYVYYCYRNINKNTTSSSFLLRTNLRISNPVSFSAMPCTPISISAVNSCQRWPVSKHFSRFPVSYRRYRSPILSICQSSRKDSEELERRENATELNLVVRVEKDTCNLASFLANQVVAADVICLHGPVGAGKTFFCRCFIRELANEPNLRVTSPTFMLVNMYDNATDGIRGPPVHHYDLYRLPPNADLERLGWASALPHVISLVEWPDRLGQQLPNERLDIHFSPKIHESPVKEINSESFDCEENTERRIQLIGHGKRWKTLIEQLLKRGSIFSSS